MMVTFLSGRTGLTFSGALSVPLDLISVSSAMKTLDLGISGGGVPEGKPVSAVTVDVDGGSTVELVRRLVLGSGTLLALEGNAAPDV